METSKQLTDKLLLMGCSPRFKPYWDPAAGAALEVRQPAAIVDGQLVGTEIVFSGAATFRVWTPQVKKAKAYAARYGLRLRVLHAEAELFIPAHLADLLLPKFGAKVKRRISAACQATLKAHSFHKVPAQEASKTPRPGAAGT